MSDVPEELLGTIRQAQQGDTASRETLAELLRGKVYAYIHRITLDRERAEDLTQDTLVAILRSLDSLREVDRFWSWVFRIATNQVRDHIRSEQRRRANTMQMMEDAKHQTPERPADEGVARLTRDELAGLTHDAMGELSMRYRTVLTLRFFEDAPYTDVAAVLGCSEVSARVTFHHAKKALRKALRRRGVRDSAMAAALMAFGGVTAWPGTSAAVAAVSTAAMAETIWSLAFGAKAKLGVGAVAACLLLVLIWQLSTGRATVPDRSGPVGVHFVHQSLVLESDALGNPVSRSKGAYEMWFQMPEGPDGPFLMRMQRWDPKQTQRLCWWVQNGRGNYYVHSGRREIYISNDNLARSNYQVRTLPTDDEEFLAFVRQMDKHNGLVDTEAEKLTCRRDPQTGYLVTRIDQRFAELGNFTTRYEYGSIDPARFDPPQGMPVHDGRDAIHTRGWTYFRVSGELADRRVAGRGRLPIYYDFVREHAPWLAIYADGRLLAFDDPRGTRWFHPDGRLERCEPAGALFRGLARPWTGFHTIDVIRRDAARQRIPYTTTLVDPPSLVEVALTTQQAEIETTLRYHINMADDLLIAIEIWQGSEASPKRMIGRLAFDYLQAANAEAMVDGIEPPRVKILGDTPASSDASVLWPLRLVPSGYEQGHPSGVQPALPAAELGGRDGRGRLLSMDPVVFIES